MRNTGNRGLEAIHGVFRGGTTSLPITSANLTFAEFLTRMTKATLIHNTEHQLRQIEGNTIVSSKKKRKINAHHSTDIQNEASYMLYQKPSSYDQFVAQINAACDDGDKDAKEIIEELAPEMAKFLKDHKEWDKPKVSVATPPQKVQTLSESKRNLVVDTNSVFNQTITRRLGPIPTPFSSPEPS